MDTDKNNTDEGKRSNGEISPAMKELLIRIRRRRERIKQRQGLFSDSAELIREDRDR
jgi:hypothetical protein